MEPGDEPTAGPPSIASADDRRKLIADDDESPATGWIMTAFIAVGDTSP
jgi:hypothetical protein